MSFVSNFRISDCQLITFGVAVQTTGGQANYNKPISECIEG